jgi:trans-2,3-dihydro-3-hydroxyanthranilate isomerase
MRLLTIRSMMRYLHLDVFTDSPLSGNQLAVFPDAGKLSGELMQRIALEMNFSETTFVFPPEEPGTDFRVRIFTPRSELPMAGHPTIGTTFALAHLGRIDDGARSITLGLGIGPTPVEMEWKSSELRFAWMTQGLPEFGPIFPDCSGIASALNVSKADIGDTGLPVQIVSCGVPFLLVPLRSREAVNKAVLDRAGLLRFCRDAGIEEHEVFLFSIQPGGDDATAFSRMFAPKIGVAEDPASGAATGPLGSYLVHHGAVTPEKATKMISLQGVQMGRGSRLYISISVSRGQIHRVRVGGQAVLVGEGNLQL